MTHSELVTDIRRSMKQRKVLPYQLAQDLQGRVSKQTIYNFVVHGRVIKSDTLLLVMNELGFSFSPARRRSRL